MPFIFQIEWFTDLAWGSHPPPQRSPHPCQKKTLVISNLMFGYYENKNKRVKMHFCESPTGGENGEKWHWRGKRKNVHSVNDWTVVLRGGLNSCWGGMKVGAPSFPAELYQHSYFSSPLCIIVHWKRVFLQAGLHFCNFPITLMQPPVSSPPPPPHTHLSLSLE